MSTPETSIIIRTFNEERHLPGLMEAIGEQRYQDFEVINVDSGSYDRTTEIASEHGARLLAISSQDFTFGYSLNVGIKAATGRFVVIVSAHAKPIDDLWLEKLVAPLREDSVAMVYGRQSGVASSKYGEVRDLARTFDSRRRTLKPPLFFANNANSAIVSELWQEHPFDEGLPGQEDIEWAKHWMERGYKVIYEPDAGVYHVHEETWRQVRRRYRREALATRSIGVWRQRDALPLALREAGHLVGDLAHALREGQLRTRGREILWFRVNKSYGTLAGLLNGDAMATPVVRDALFFDRKHQAVVIHGRNQASLDEIDLPAAKPGDVLIRVAYAGVSNADLGALAGDWTLHDGTSQDYPMVPGRELSGWVAKVGANVAHLKEGDPVVVQSAQGCGSCQSCRASNSSACDRTGSVDPTTGMGAYAEYVSTAGQFVHKLPEGAEMSKAVLCEALATVLKGLRKLDQLVPRLSEPPSFAIVGAGPIGHLCAQVLAIREFPVTVFDRNPARLSYFDGTPISTATDTARLGAYEVLVEATGDPEALQQMLDASKAGATLLLLGLPYSRRQFTVDAGAASDKTIVWSVGAGRVDFEEAIKLLPRLPLNGVTDCVVPLSRFNEAWEVFRRGENLKVLLKVS